MIRLLYEDGEALVIDKPAGVPIDRPRAGGPALADRLGELRLGFQRSPTPVHRLDTDTSGCLLLARNPKAHKRFAKAFETRAVAKRYLGLVLGEPAADEGTIELALAKVSTAAEGWRMVPARDGKAAVTHWRALAAHGGFTLVEFRPETGRTHQIRVHAASGLGTPLAGDPVYGSGIGTGDHAPRTMLHAASLAVPRQGKPTIDAHAPLPADFAQLGFAHE